MKRKLTNNSSKLERFLEKLNSDPQYFKKFLDDPAGFFSEEVLPPNQPLSEALKTQLNDYVHKALKDYKPPGNVTLSIEDYNALKIIIKIYLG